ncbi:MAG: hypothetical protein ABIS86_12595 [Streptosporangiaceae bacterium]
MSGDGWLDPGTCGVQLAMFDQLTDIMNRSGPDLEQLAQQLYKALSTAGVDTAPALEIARIARWANEAGPDLKRRHRLAHDLDAQKLAMVACVTEGTFVKFPDRLGDQQGMVSGYQAAELFTKAMAGDRRALADLENYQDLAGNPWFAKALLDKLGPLDLVQLPVKLAHQLRLNQAEGRPGTSAEQTRAALALLGKALAAGTRPLGPGYVGNRFLTDLQAAGQTGFPSRSPQYAGYQGLGAILAATGGTVRYSEAFLRTVGRDMIDYSRQQPTSSWKPIPDVAALTDLGTLLDQPGQAETAPGDYLIGLLTAAGASRLGAQVLLDHTPANAENTNLYYLLHTRREAWAASDRGSALGTAINAAAAGSDEVSGTLFTEIQQVYGADALAHLEYGEGHTLIVDDLGQLNQLSGLRTAMAHVLLAHLDDVTTQLDIAGTSFEADAPERARLLLAVIAATVQDDQAFETLMKAHIGRLRIAMEQRSMTGSDDDVIIYAKEIGRLLALRTELAAAPADATKAENEKIKSWIDDGLGWVTISGYLEKFGISPTTAGYVDGKVSSKIGDLIFEQVGDHSQDRNTESSRVAQEDPFYRLVSQMLVTSTATHLKYDPKTMDGAKFTENGKIVPVPWTDAQLQDFIRWCKVNNVDLVTLRETVRGTMSGAREETIDSFAEVSKRVS